MLTLLNLSQRFMKMPSEIMGLYDSYTAWCFNEAALYILGKLSSGSDIPDEWLPRCNKIAVADMLQHRGVIFNDRRRNDQRQSDT